MNCNNLSTNRNSRHIQAIVPRSGTSTRFEYVLGYKLPVLQIYAKLSVLQIYQTLSVMQIYHKLSVLQIYHKLTVLKMYQTLPVLQTYRQLKLHHVTYQIFTGSANHTVTT